MNNEEKILAMLEKMDARLEKVEIGQAELKKDMAGLKEDVTHIRYMQDKHTNLLLKAVNAIASMDSAYSDRLMAK